MARTFEIEDAPGLSLRAAEGLNAQQRAVVEAGGGPLLVIAGAGSGKTRVLTQRVAHLLDGGTPPHRILLLTFTNRAAAEMTARVEAVVGGAARGIWSGTFHSVARRILRQFADRLGYPPGFGILDREDSESLMKQVVAECDGVGRETRFPRAGVLVTLLSRAANTGRTALDVLSAEYPRFVPDAAEIERVLLSYQSRKFAAGLVDFDDLLVLWLRLLEEDGAARDELVHRFEHVLVDEYQDTNGVQCALVDRMASGHGNLMVVGDDAQCIYSFRGAEFRNILEFPSRHPAAVLYRLETNYRSSPEILALANHSIAHNRARFEKHLVAATAPGLLPGHVRCTTEEEQSAFVSQRVLQLRDEGVELDQIAVLYRAHWQSMQLQIELGRRRIPFRVQSGMRFFEQRHVKDVLAFLRVAENPRDEVAFSRLMGLCEGIGPRTGARLFAHLQAAPTPRDGLASPDALGLAGRRGAGAWQRVSRILLRVMDGAAGGDVAAALDHVVEQFYETYALGAFDNGANRIREIQSLAELGSRYESVGEFLASTALASEVAGVDQIEAGGGDEKLVLSSVHQAKGLEFHAVFVIWLAEDRFPSAQSALDDDLEEERRLFYVAVTRAKRELYLVAPATAQERGVGLVTLRSSPFVREVEAARPSILERISLVRKRRGP